MASHSKSVLSYRDVHQAFEAAGRVGTITLRFPDPGKAVTWCGRANAYRVLLRTQNKELGRPFTSDFDHLMIRRRPGENIVKIEPRGFGFVAEGPDGALIEFDQVTLPKGSATPEEISETERDTERFLAEYEATFGKAKPE